MLYPFVTYVGTNEYCNILETKYSTDFIGGYSRCNPEGVKRK